MSKKRATVKAVPGRPMDSRESFCTGRGTASGDHCCYVAGETCRYLAVAKVSTGRRYECSLRRDLGSWEAVHADPGYQEHVQSVWDSLGTRPDGTPVIPSCGEWQPREGECCREPR